MRRMLLGGLVAVVPACTLYAGSGDDGVDAAVVPWVFDAQIAADAPDDSSCAVEINCPTATPGRVTVCGRLYDVETDQRVEGATASQLAIRFYDALDFAGNPSGATPLIPTAYTQDDCGRFVAENLPRPSLGFLGIGVDDASGEPDEHRLSGVAFPVTSGQVLRSVRAFSLRTTTDAAWTAQAGLAGQTFVDRGVVLTLFTDGAGNPVSGVRVVASGSTRPADDFYFSDADAVTRATVDPAMSTTGVNGASLMLNSALVEHTGTGGEPAGCGWSSSLAAAIPGVVFVQRTQLESSTTGAPCEP